MCTQTQFVQYEWIQIATNKNIDIQNVLWTGMTGDGPQCFWINGWQKGNGHLLLKLSPSFVLYVLLLLLLICFYCNAIHDAFLFLRTFTCRNSILTRVIWVNCRFSKYIDIWLYRFRSNSFALCLCVVHLWIIADIKYIDNWHSMINTKQYHEKSIEHCPLSVCLFVYLCTLIHIQINAYVWVLYAVCFTHNSRITIKIPIKLSMIAF